MLDEAPGSTAAGEGGGNGALIVVGILVLLGAAGGVLYFVSKKPPEEQKITTVQSSSAPEPETTLDLPPPPPEAPEVGPEDTGVDAGEDTKKVAVGVPSGGGCSAACAGILTPDVEQAVAARAGTARQCYKTALEGNEGIAGDMSVLVKVGPDGSTCSASVIANSTGSNRLAQCVQQKMYAAYPHPKGGCVDVKVPINFKPKT